MYEKYLPIGTVVLLKGGTKRIMITGFCCKDNKDAQKEYDYCGLIFPEGYIGSDILLFDHNQIEKIFYLGLNDNENKEFHANLKQFLEDKN